jgi:Arc/MetJ family transcription regulator
LEPGVRTNIDIDDHLLAEAQAASGATTKKEAVHRGLELLVRLGRQAEVRQLRGKLHWEGDLDAQRRDV